MTDLMLSRRASDEVAVKATLYGKADFLHVSVYPRSPILSASGSLAWSEDKKVSHWLSWATNEDSDAAEKVKGRTAGAPDAESLAVTAGSDGSKLSRIQCEFVPPNPCSLSC